MTNYPNTSTIVVKNETKAKLKDLKIVEQESFDSVIQRLMKK